MRVFIQRKAFNVLTFSNMITHNVAWSPCARVCGVCARVYCGNVGVVVRWYARTDILCVFVTCSEWGAVFGPIRSVDRG